MNNVLSVIQETFNFQTRSWRVPTITLLKPRLCFSCGVMLVWHLTWYNYTITVLPLLLPALVLSVTQQIFYVTDIFLVTFVLDVMEELISDTVCWHLSVIRLTVHESQFHCAHHVGVMRAHGGMGWHRHGGKNKHMEAAISRGTVSEAKHVRVTLAPIHTLAHFLNLILE